MERLLVYEVKEWEQLFWFKFKAFLDQIDNDRVEEKERLTREWRADCWRRLNPQMHAALKRFADVDDFFCVNLLSKIWVLEVLGDEWATLIRRLFEGVDNLDGISLSKLRGRMGDENEEMRLRMEKEIEDTELRLKRGSDLGRFDQFWDDDTLFDCRYSQSKWLHFAQDSTVPVEIYSHALKGNKNITHISFSHFKFDFDVNLLLCDLPWVTSTSLLFYVTTHAVRRDLLFIPSFDNDLNDGLNTFAKEIKLDPSSTYIFSDLGTYDAYSHVLMGGNTRVLISFVAPTSGKRLILRVKHSGKEDAPLELTLGLTKIHLNPSSKSSLTMDDITLYSIEVSGPSESDHLSFVPEVRNDIFIRFIQSDECRDHDHFLHDIELLDDEDSLEYYTSTSHSASLSKLSN